MCRMIIACGTFSVTKVMSAARAMAAGETATHDGVIKQHTNGWGCLWASNGQIRTLRGGDSFLEAYSKIDFSSISTNFLAVHVRHATLSRNCGVEYAHPLQRKSGRVRWYMMHNGFLPTVYRCIGRAVSHFDSAEYLEYIVDSIEPADISEEYLVAKLAGLPSGGSSGNCFLVTQDKAWAWQWYSEDAPCPEYFTMRYFEGDKVNCVSSEIIPFLADEAKWHSMRDGELYELDMRR